MVLVKNGDYIVETQDKPKRNEGGVYQEAGARLIRCNPTGMRV